MASENRFWDFSLTLYGRDGVADACLYLQTARELDVNILLFCAWAGASGAPPFTSAQIADVCALVDGWHMEVVRTLRSLRTLMKSNPHRAPEEASETLRNAIKSNELKAEQIEQNMLFQGYPISGDEALGATQKRSTAGANMASYVAHLGSLPTSEESGWIQIIENKISITV